MYDGIYVLGGFLIVIIGVCSGFGDGWFWG